MIYKGRLKELNLCCLAKQQLMGEGWITEYRHLRGDATGPDHIPGMLSPARPCHDSRQAQGAPRSHAGLGTPIATGHSRQAKLGNPGTAQTYASPGAPLHLPPSSHQPGGPPAALHPKSRGNPPPAAQFLQPGTRGSTAARAIQKVDKRLICSAC